MPAGWCCRRRNEVGIHSYQDPLNMAGARILVVEGEKVVAEEIRQKLERMGYEVAGTISSGEEALARTRASRPDLMILDTRLGGDLDGISVAEIVRETLSIPIIFLTDLYNKESFERASATQPVGYLVKPLKEGELESLVQTALSMHYTDDKLLQSYRWMSKALSARDVGIIGFDTHDCVRFINEFAEKLTGWRIEEVFGSPVTDLMQISEGEQLKNDARGIMSMLEGGPRSPVLHGLLRNKDGTNRQVTLWTIPFMNNERRALGNALAFKESRAPGGSAGPDLDDRMFDDLKADINGGSRIFFAGGDSFVRLGFREALSGYPEFRIDGEAANQEQFKSEIVLGEWSAVVIDCHFLTRPLEDTIVRLKLQHPEWGFLILCTLTALEHIDWARAHGMSVFVTSGGAGDIVNALRQVVAGQVYLSPLLLNAKSEHPQTPSTRQVFGLLSEREKKVFHLIVVGKSVKEISAELNLSAKTVSTYRSRLLRKLSLKSTADLVSFAIKHQLLS
jgi:PAS domain S-box-containing protein